jgi:hypothetical protein
MGRMKNEKREWRKMWVNARAILRRLDDVPARHLKVSGLQDALLNQCSVLSSMECDYLNKELTLPPPPPPS